MTSKSGEQAIVINILTNILRSKSNKEMKRGQLIEYNTQAVVEKLLLDPFLKKSKLKISLDQ